MKVILRSLLKPLSFVPALVIMYVIFRFSAQTGVESSEVSIKTSRYLVAAAGRFFHLGIDPAQAEEFAQQIHFYVRKLGHVTIYFLLAVSVSFPLYVYGLRGIWLVLTAGFLCVSYAFFDEYHQSFVEGRGPSVRDVYIDACGSLLGIIIVQMICFMGRMTIFRPLSNRRKMNGTERE